LHPNENVWVDNAHTVFRDVLASGEPTKPVGWKCGDRREVHGLWLKSGSAAAGRQADVVEFHPQPDSPDVPFPVSTSAANVGSGITTTCSFVLETVVFG